MAYAAQQFGVRSDIFVPSNTDPTKLARLEDLAARVTTFPDIETARRAARDEARNRGSIFSSAYNDVDMMIGAATLGLELAEEMPDLDVLVVPIGGGGLAAGVAAALAVERPEIQVWAAASASSPTWIRWHAAARPVSVELEFSVAEGLSGPIEPETVTFEPVRRLVPKILPVTDSEVCSAMLWLAEHHQQIVEPSGAASVAAVIHRRSELAGLRTGAVITGRNVGLRRFLNLIATTEAQDPLAGGMTGRPTTS